jgi:hypothetical protein
LTIACCDRHAPDLLVAVLAGEKLGVDATVVAPGAISDGAAFILACAEGVAACRAAGVRGLVVGDGEGVIWWKTVELRQSPQPLASRAGGGAIVAPLPVPLENRGLLHAVPLTDPLGLHTVARGALAAGVPQVLQTPFDPVEFAGLLASVPTACLLPRQVDALPAGSQWVSTPPGLCWHHPVTVDLDAEGGFGVGLATAALSA